MKERPLGDRRAFAALSAAPILTLNRRLYLDIAHTHTWQPTYLLQDCCFKCISFIQRSFTIHQQTTDCRGRGFDWQFPCLVKKINSCFDRTKLQVLTFNCAAMKRYYRICYHVAYRFNQLDFTFVYSSDAAMMVAVSSEISTRISGHHKAWKLCLHAGYKIVSDNVSS